MLSICAQLIFYQSQRCIESKVSCCTYTWYRLFLVACYCLFLFWLFVCLHLENFPASSFSLCSIFSISHPRPRGKFFAAKVFRFSYG